MSALERFAALLARLGTLERHALTLDGPSTDPAIEAEVSELIETLRRVRYSLDPAVVPQPSSLEAMERTLDAASLLLASLKGST
jgi:hypothetical protein